MIQASFGADVLKDMFIIKWATLFDLRTTDQKFVVERLVALLHGLVAGDGVVPAPEHHAAILVVLVL